MISFLLFLHAFLNLINWTETSRNVKCNYYSFSLQQLCVVNFQEACKKNLSYYFHTCKMKGCRSNFQKI